MRFTNRSSIRVFTVFSLVFCLATQVSTPSLADIPAPAKVIEQPSLFEEIKDEKTAPEFTKNDALQDTANRISADFAVPDYLKQRVSFWFDIYTHYSANQYVFHDQDYPWVIYHVVDVTTILNGKGRRIARAIKAEKYVTEQKALVRQALNSLSRKIQKSNFNSSQLKGLEKNIYAATLVIPGSRKKVFQKNARVFRTQLGQKDFIQSGINSSSSYFPLLNRIFNEKGLPQELTYLPFVESSFNENATSKVGASGIWQFTNSTGKSFMTINDSIDERRSPLKSSIAAAKLLRQNYKIMKTWPLALTAYNHGTAGLLKATRKLKTNDFEIILNKHSSKSFDFASKNFFSEFLAVLHAVSYKDKFYVEPGTTGITLTQNLTLNKSVRGKTLLNFINMRPAELLALNPDLDKDFFKKNLLLPRGYRVFVTPRAHRQLVAKGAAPKSLATPQQTL